jgi:tetratricopeptide (TPR) repeat protein
LVSPQWTALLSLCVSVTLTWGLASSTPAARANSVERHVAELDCRRAAGFESAGDEGDARKQYIGALEAEPSLACGASGLARVAAREASEAHLSSEVEAKRLCEVGEALQRAHRDSDARDAFKSAEEKNPGRRCASKGLDATSASVFSRASESAQEILPKVLLWALIVFVGVLIALVFVPLRVIGFLMSVFPFLRRFFGARLTVEDCDDSALDKKVGKALSAAVRERLQSFREEALDATQPAYGAEFATGNEELVDQVSGNSQLKNAFNKLSEANEQAKLLGALAELIVTVLPIARFTVAGVLLPPVDVPVAGAAGAQRSSAVSLFIERDSKLAGAVNLTGKAIAGDPGAADYVALAGPAAVWLQYELARQLSGAAVEADAAESYALVNEGIGYFYSGQPAQARLAFERAIQLSSRNWAARSNLALTIARAERDYARAVDVLRHALHDLIEEAA